jgi:hypothetical protein
MPRTAPARRLPPVGARLSAPVPPRFPPKHPRAAPAPGCLPRPPGPRQPARAGGHAGPCLRGVRFEFEASVHRLQQGPARVAAHAARPPPRQGALLQVRGGRRAVPCRCIAHGVLRVAAPQRPRARAGAPLHAVPRVAAPRPSPRMFSQLATPQRAIHFPTVDQEAMTAAREAWFAECGGPPPGNKLALERKLWQQPVDAGAISARGRRVRAGGMGVRGFARRA